MFNRYEDEKTTATEVTRTLAHLAQTEDVEFSLYHGILSGPEFRRNLRITRIISPQAAQIRKASRATCQTKRSSCV
ncbi:MAG: hypothetical protein LBS62_01085 [Clostridiales bacterium]|nr:hypothetical protein [Clostridiales bacterium]